MKLFQSITEFVYRFKRFRFVRLLFSKPYSFIQNRKQVIQRKKRLAVFKKNGIEAIRMFDQCMTENGYPYSLIFGTLLGAVREKGFIPHDDDIDTVMWFKDYSSEVISKLQAYGFKLLHTYSVDQDLWGKEITLDYKGVNMDIFFLYEDEGEYPYCCDFMLWDDCISIHHAIIKHGGLLPRKLEMPFSHETIRVDFYDMKLPVPINYHVFLSFRYGENYMIPDVKWHPRTTNKHVIEHPEKLGVYKEFSSCV